MPENGRRKISIKKLSEIDVTRMYTKYIIVITKNSPLTRAILFPLIMLIHTKLTLGDVAIYLYFGRFIARFPYFKPDYSKHPFGVFCFK